MRKITKEATAALKDGRSFKGSNTAVSLNTDKDRWEMRLHNNLIAYRTCGVQRLYISNAGWTSNTTKERLNGVLDTFNKPYRIYQEDFVWYICDWSNDVTKDFPSDTFIEVI